MRILSDFRLPTLNFYEVTLIIGKHFKFLTNTISRRRRGDYKPQVTEPKVKLIILLFYSLVQYEVYKN